MSDDDADFAPYRPGPLPEGIKKDVIKAGKGYRRPKSGDELTVHYVGTLESDGSEFDSSRAREEPITLTVGKGEVIKGWDIGLCTMQKGEVARFTLQPEFAYGEPGMAPAIPPSAVLVFEIELISWVGKDDLFGDGSVIKVVVTDGAGWNNPKKGSEVCLTLKAVSGEKVHKELKSVDYVLGSGDLGSLTTAVDKGLEGMIKDEKCMLLCEGGDVVQGASKVKIELTLEDVYEISDVSIQKDLSVMKKTLRDTDDYEKPSDGYKATVKVEAATDGNKVPLPGFKAATLSFICGNGEVCDAIEAAVIDMKVSERALITSTAAKCKEPKVGLQDVAGEKVIFTLELVEREKAPDIWSMHYEDKLTTAMARKDMGAKLFKEKRFELALDKYRKVQDLVRETNNWSEECKEIGANMKHTSELNKAACFLLLGDPASCLVSCNEVLQSDPHNVKAIFRRAKAHFARNENVEALRDLERVVEMDATNTEAKQLIPKVKASQKLADKASKDTFAKMCQGFGKLGSGKENKKPAKEEAKEEEDQPDPEIVNVTFRIDLKLPAEETLYALGQPEPLGGGDVEKAIAMQRIPQPWEQPIGSGRDPPEKNIWEGTAELNQDEGRVEYRYVIKGPGGTRVEQGDPHVVQIGGMGGCRQRTTDHWREKPGC